MCTRIFQGKCAGWEMVSTMLTYAPVTQSANIQQLWGAGIVAPGVEHMPSMPSRPPVHHSSWLCNVCVVGNVDNMNNMNNTTQHHCCCCTQPPITHRNPRNQGEKLQDSAHNKSRLGLYPHADCYKPHKLLHCRLRRARLAPWHRQCSLCCRSHCVYSFSS